MERNTDGTLKRLRPFPKDGWLRSPEAIARLKEAHARKRERSAGSGRG